MRNHEGKTRAKNNTLTRSTQYVKYLNQ